MQTGTFFGTGDECFGQGESCLHVLIVDKPTLRELARDWPGAHALLPTSRYLTTFGYRPLVERGFDLDGNGRDTDAFAYDAFVAVLDRLHAPATPGSNGRSFNTDGQQTWATSTQGPRYTAIVGRRTSRDTVGQVRAGNRVACSGFIRQTCRLVEAYTATMTFGDDTVPIVSSARCEVGSTGACRPDAPNLAAGSLRIFRNANQSALPAVSHNGLLSTPAVQNTILEILGGQQPPGSVGDPGLAEQPLAVPDDGAVTPTTVLNIAGADAVTVEDALGNSTESQDPTRRGFAPGLSMHTHSEVDLTLVLSQGST